jgi:hypothetical protein
MQQFNWKNRKPVETEAAPLDPIALTLALWLGLVVGVTGLMRLAENAAANAPRAQQDQQRAATAIVRPTAMLLSPYGS